MRRALRWILGAAAGLLLVAMVLFSVSRLRGPSAPQREARALMEREDTPPGRNAFAAMWLLKYDLPEARQEEIAAEDVRRFGQRRPEPTGAARTATPPPPFESLAARSYPVLELGADEQRLLCQLRDPGCLDTVRRHRDALAKLVGKHQRLIERTRDLEHYDYIRSGFPARIDAPFALPNTVEGLRLARTADALAFVEGRSDDALAGLCRGTRPWRRFLRHSDTLMDQMVSAAAVTGAMDLFVDMLAEMPAGQPLPSACAAAFAVADTDELSLCRSLRGEYRFASEMAAYLERVDSPMGSRLGDAVFPLLYDADKTRSLSAVEYARACSTDVHRQLAGDQKVQWPRPERSPYRFECWGNYLGCVIVESASPSFAAYQHRLQDLAARLRLLNTILWLRANAGDRRPLETRLAERPQELRSAGRDVAVTEGGRALRIALFETASTPWWEVPLPVELSDDAGIRQRL